MHCRVGFITNKKENYKRKIQTPISTHKVSYVIIAYLKKNTV